MTLIETNSACFTVMVKDADFPLSLALTVAFPTPLVVTVPLSVDWLLTDTTVESFTPSPLESAIQVTLELTSTLFWFVRKASTVSLELIPFASSKEDWLSARAVISAGKTVRLVLPVIPLREATMFADSSPEV